MKKLVALLACIILLSGCSPQGASSDAVGADVGEVTGRVISIKSDTLDVYSIYVEWQNGTDLPVLLQGNVNIRRFEGGSQTDAIDADALGGSTYIEAGKMVGVSYISGDSKAFKDGRYEISATYIDGKESGVAKAEFYLTANCIAVIESPAPTKEPALTKTPVPLPTATPVDTAVVNGNKKRYATVHDDYYAPESFSIFENVKTYSDNKDITVELIRVWYDSFDYINWPSVWCVRIGNNTRNDIEVYQLSRIKKSDNGGYEKYVLEHGPGIQAVKAMTTGDVILFSHRVGNSAGDYTLIIDCGSAGVLTVCYTIPEEIGGENFPRMEEYENGDSMYQFWD